MNQEHEDLIEKFYQSFANLDAEGMAACYHQDIVFEDPAFGELNGEHAGNMWRMLCASQKGKGFVVKHFAVVADDKNGTAEWEAWYTFSKTGRKVHNKISAQFEFSDGKIIKHVDSFDLRKWAKQALGFKGILLGGTNFFKKKLQAQTNSMLRKFERSF